jgi:hypothetical protein
MAKLYTEEDLIRFLYNETLPEESNEISIAMYSNSELMNECEMLKETISVLDCAELLPSPTSISIIMEAAHRQSEALAH